MKIFLIISLVISSSFLLGQDIKVTLNKEVNGLCHLAKFNGQGSLLYADTGYVKNGVVVFDGSKQVAGMMSFVYSGSRLDFIYDNKKVALKTDTVNLFKNLVVEESEDTKFLYGFFKTQSSVQPEMAKLDTTIKYTKDEKELENLYAQKKALYSKVADYQKDIIKKHPDLLISKYFQLALPFEIPNAPEGMEAEDTAIWKARWVWKNYWSEIDLTNDAICRHPLWKNKVNDFTSKWLPQNNPDTLYHYIALFINAIPDNTEMLRASLETIRVKYNPDKEKRMGFDKVWVYLILDYYNEKKFPWGDKKIMKELKDRAEAMERVLVGNQAKPLTLLDAFDNTWHDIYKIPQDYLVLVFWSPSCGHCKKEMPVLSDLYKDSLRDMGIEIMAISRGDDATTMKEWQDFCDSNKFEWINAGLTPDLLWLSKDDSTALSYDAWVKFMQEINMPWNDSEMGKQMAQNVGKRGAALKLNYLLGTGTTTIGSLNYSQTYDVYSTPKLLILDKDRKIIAKQLGPNQLVGFFKMVLEQEAKKDKKKG
jgi:thiol-disulfide isomerase/thioredoxin